MRVGPVLIVLLAVLLSAGAALAGYLQSDSGSAGASGSTFRVLWSVGVTTDYSVVDRLGQPVIGLSPLVVNEGPNSCNDDAIAGNARAYFVTAASDDAGPYDPDGYVDCNLCDCESVPGTNFNCRSSDGRCLQCNACSQGGGNADCADNTNGETICDPGSTCDEYDCVCDTTDCGDLTGDWGECTYSGTKDCGLIGGTKSRTEYYCSGDSCVSRPDRTSCAYDLGDCPSGFACELNECVPSGPGSCDCDMGSLTDDNCNPGYAPSCWPSPPWGCRCT